MTFARSLQPDNTTIMARSVFLLLAFISPHFLFGQADPSLPPLPTDPLPLPGNELEPLPGLPPLPGDPGLDPAGGGAPPLPELPGIDLPGEPPVAPTTPILPPLPEDPVQPEPQVPQPEPIDPVVTDPPEPQPEPAIDPPVAVPPEPNPLEPATSSALLPDFVTDSANLTKVLDEIRALMRKNDHVRAQSLIDGTLREFGDKREYAFYMRQVRREQNNLWHEMAQKAMNDKDYALARRLLDKYREGVKREMEDRQRAGQIRLKETKQDVSLVGKLVRELEEAKKNLAEARAKAGEPETDLIPNFDQIMALERRQKQDLINKAEKLLLKAKKDAADGQYNTAHEQIEKGLTLFKDQNGNIQSDVSTIALISDLFKEKERIVWFQMGEAMQKGQVASVEHLITIYEQIEIKRRKVETETPGVTPVAKTDEAERKFEQIRERKKRQMELARKTLAEARGHLAKKRYVEAEKLLFQISNNLEPDYQTWPLIREAAMEYNRINLLKAEDARRLKDWKLARDFTEKFRQNLFQNRNLVSNDNEPERPGLTEREREKELLKSERINKRVESDMKNPSSRDITEFDPDWHDIKDEEDELLMQGRVRFLAGDLTGAVEVYRTIETRAPDNNEAKAMLRRISELRESNSYLGYQKTKAEMLEWIRYEWELPKVFDRTVSEATEVQARESPLFAKIQRIEIPGVNFFDTDLSEVMNTLMMYSRQNDFAEPDPAAKGVNIIPMLQGEAPPKVTIQLNKMPLQKMLDFITEMVGWTYEVRDDAIVVSKAGGENALIRGLEIEFFEVSQGTIQRMTGGAAAGGGGGGAPDPFNPGGGGAAPDDRADKIRQFIINAGIEFDDAKGHKFVFDGFQLIVTNTRRNLDKLTRLLAKLDKDSSKQVEIETKFIEVQQGALDEISFDWNINWGTSTPLFDPRTGLPQIDSNGDVIMRFAKNVVGNTRTLAQAHSTTGTGDTGTSITFPNNPSANQVFPTPPPQLPRQISVGTGVTPLVDLTGTNVLSSGQAQLLISALNRKQGTDLLSAPRITVMDGQPASITIAQEFIYPTDWQAAQLPGGGGGGGGFPGGGGLGGGIQLQPATPQFETVAPDDEQPGFREVGVEMDVTPRVDLKYNTIHLELQPKVTEFDGFIEYGGRSAMIGTGLATPTIIQPSGILMPIFSVRKVSTSVTIFDGATVIIGGLVREEIKTVNDRIPILGNIPLLGNLFRSNAESYSKRNLLIFVTANIVSQGGSPTRERIQSIDDGSIFRHPVLLTPTGAVRRNFRDANAQE